MRCTALSKRTARQTCAAREGHPRHGSTIRPAFREADHALAPAGDNDIPEIYGEPDRHNSVSRPTRARPLPHFVISLGLAVIAMTAPVDPVRAADPKTVIVLLDLSDSTQAHRKDYRAYFEKILEACGPGDVVIAAKIAAEPFAGSNIVARAEFPESSMMANRAEEKSRLLTLRRTVLLAVDKALAAVSTENPILDSLLLPGRQFAASQNRRALVVVLSEMKEHGRGLRFEGSRTALDRVIDKVLRAKNVAVAGIKVLSPARAMHATTSSIASCGISDGVFHQGGGRARSDRLWTGIAAVFPVRTLPSGDRGSRCNGGGRDDEP